MEFVMFRQENKLKKENCGGSNLNSSTKRLSDMANIMPYPAFYFVNIAQVLVHRNILF